MGQYEILAFLEEQKRLHPDKWFSTNDIKKSLRARGMSPTCLNGITRHLGKLLLFGMINFKVMSVWETHKVFQAKSG